MQKFIKRHQVAIRMIIGVLIAWKIQQETGWWTFGFVLITLFSHELEALTIKVKRENDNVENKEQSRFQDRLEKAIKEQKRF